MIIIISRDIHTEVLLCIFPGLLSALVFLESAPFLLFTILAQDQLNSTRLLHDVIRYHGAAHTGNIIMLATAQVSTVFI